MRLTRTSDLWWKNAVVYCLDVETYQDSDGDGTGDFAGLTQRIDHLVRLGVTCVWLMPFYPTRERDDGYDITDFYGVDPRLGTLGDFTEFVRTARDRGIRVIADLVVNHTSDHHPWFQDARSSRTSAHRDWYVWCDTPPEDGPEGVVFPDAERSVWELDKTTGQYYLHRFFKQQPDLNVANPAVRDEIARIMGYWLQLGLSGFRVDAVPFLLETDGQEDADRLPDPHEYLADLRAFVGRRNGDAVLLGEVNLPYADTAKFFGEPESGRGDELTMCFDFIGMQRMYLSMARGEAGPLAAALRERPGAPRDAHWATFVRNHDELTLDKLDDDERAEVFAAFGPDEDMQLYGRGLRRRLPPMVAGDRRRVELAYSLLFTLPGTPVLFYGEEIGMGENLAAEGRQAVRTPMQWTPDKGGGFSTADGDALPNPVVAGAFGPKEVNVHDQTRDQGSLLGRMRTLIERYREAPELAWGTYEVLDTDDPGVLAHISSLAEGAVLAVHNFSDRPVTATMTVPRLKGGRLVTDILTGDTLKSAAGGVVRTELEPYGYLWLRVNTPLDDPDRTTAV
ncbi:alpha-amylase family protein [Streptomyces fulvorobeus]|uniref:Alpha-amylase n=1 Tax=Streptomyces fulvorobeus TaxID=284028 RepID=A0A7J0C0R7_9ACTN|nr:alpha-amylase family protein [Streptomyces fulvorobeus]NYE39399.1 maltose alpha-D-glucosyltransferase/alpha-amylase [Streptomyces fulvorobeus]GFM95627.1 alpha-amylase [Streptomyces fulvorobeus]